MDLKICKKCGKQLYFYHFSKTIMEKNEIFGLCGVACGNKKQMVHESVIELSKENKKLKEELFQLLKINPNETVFINLIENNELLEKDKLKILNILKKMEVGKFCKFYAEQFLSLE